MIVNVSKKRLHKINLIVLLNKWLLTDNIRHWQVTWVTVDSLRESIFNGYIATQMFQTLY